MRIVTQLCGNMTGDNMKTHVYTVDCWQGYCNKAKELCVVLTQGDYRVLMQSYIHGESIEDAITKLKGV